MKTSMTTQEYAAAFPACPRHMLGLAVEPQRQGAKKLKKVKNSKLRNRKRANPYLDSGMILTEESWCTFEGGYIRWVLMDVRKYVEMGLTGWAVFEATPFRVYVSDYDDWNTEKMFTTREEAEEVVALLQSGPLRRADLWDLGFRSM